jgi:hypothetical protein
LNVVLLLLQLPQSVLEAECPIQILIARKELNMNNVLVAVVWYSIFNNHGSVAVIVLLKPYVLVVVPWQVQTWLLDESSRTTTAKNGTAMVGLPTANCQLPTANCDRKTPLVRFAAIASSSCCKGVSRMMGRGCGE